MSLEQWRFKSAALAAAMLLLAGGLSACAEDAGQTAEPAKIEANGTSKNGDGENGLEEPTDNEQLMREFALVVEHAESAADIKTFIEANVESASTGDADEMLAEWMTYAERTLHDVQDRFFESNVQDVLLQTEMWPITADNAARIKDEAVRALVQSTLAAGYKLEAVEGSIYPVVDYAAIGKFGERASGEVADFVAIKAMESNERTASDGAIVIGWNDLAERVLTVENYLRDYPESANYAAAKQLFENYMTVYLQGLDNTPIFDYETLLLLKEVEASYRKLVGENPGTASAEIVRGYLKALDEAGGVVMTQDAGGELRVADAVDKYRSGLSLKIGSLLDE